MKTCALLLLLLLPSQVFTEGSPLLSTDSRVRITAPTAFSNPLTGNIARIQRDTLLLTPRTRIPFNSITKLELSLGVQPLGKRVHSKAWKGALLVGGIVSASLIDNWDDWDDRSGNKALLAILGGSVAGGTIGGLFGALHRPERWTTLPPDHLKRYTPPIYRK
ncbi:MAG: hypothetical protein HOE48_26315 [Candidatus Latescibacteria bacterium]|jgi:hypothetical protein|nr:hypothetical protein [Candidatus Latescibacterota bacterium]MBT4141451.1 hypothetical protein [Candidatus Latescibacterota bacterium]MBT5831442.1 hypothetical protein [Candidatus Latescibacterota bacterium]